MHQHQLRLTALLAGIGTASGMKRECVRTVGRPEKGSCTVQALNVTHLLRGELPMPGGSMPMLRKLPTSTGWGTGSDSETASRQWHVNLVQGMFLAQSGQSEHRWCF